MRDKIKTFDIHNIQIVYNRHALYPNTVLYSTDGGYVWQSVPMDSGKWHINEWLFAFVEVKLGK